jgi:hypothetical protein
MDSTVDDDDYDDGLPFPAGLLPPVMAALTALCEASLEQGMPLDAVAVARLGVEVEAAQSLRGQLHTRGVRKAAGRVRAAMPQLAVQWRRQGAPGRCAALAKQVQYPPYLFARLLVEVVLQVPRSKVSELMRQPASISDPLLRDAVAEALAADHDNSPANDEARHRVGVAYEQLLQARLVAQGLPFESEDELREQGLAKTPDVRLSIPVGVRDPKTHQWREVNWVDSKALFGDAHVWQQEHFAQLEGYVHRYGTGLVVYWCGFEAALLADPELASPDVAVRRDWPSELLYPGARAPTRLPLGDFLRQARPQPPAPPAALISTEIPNAAAPIHPAP